MKRRLTKRGNPLYHVSDGQVVLGGHSNLKGDCSGLRGNCSGLKGSLDACELTAEERDAGVDIKDLVQEGE